MKLADLGNHGRRQPTRLDVVLGVIQVVGSIVAVLVIAFAMQGAATSTRAFVALGLVVAFLALWVVRSALLSKRPIRDPREPPLTPES